MDQVFERILEIENRAREVYEEATREKKRMEDNLLRLTKEREAEIREMADAKIKELALEGKKDVDGKIHRIQRQTSEKIAFLDSECSKKYDEWVNHVFNQVIGV